MIVVLYLMLFATRDCLTLYTSSISPKVRISSMLWRIGRVALTDAQYFSPSIALRVVFKRGSIPSRRYLEVPLPMSAGIRTVDKNCWKWVHPRNVPLFTYMDQDMSNWLDDTSPLIHSRGRQGICCSCRWKPCPMGRCTWRYIQMDSCHSRQDLFPE